MQAVCMISGQYPLAVDRLFGSLGDLGYGWGGGGGGVGGGLRGSGWLAHDPPGRQAKKIAHFEHK